MTGTLIAPLVARHDFPADWRIVLILFPGAAGRHGAGETEAFQKLHQHPTRLDTDRLCRLTLLGMLPAVIEADLPAFSAALSEFNRLVGEAFAPVQGGVYAYPAAAEIIAYIRSQGIAGAGQSSWGPGLFAIVADQERAEHLAEGLRQRFGLASSDVVATWPRNKGADFAE